MRALLDTDVVLDYLLARPPFARAASELWHAAEDGHYEAFVSAITPVNVFYIARKLKGQAQAKKTIEGLLAVCQIAIVDAQVLKGALKLPMKDYEDAVQLASARRISLDLIVTRNISDYEGADIPVLTPEQFLAQLAPH